MKTEIFAYRGIIGISSNVKAEGLINNPEAPGQMGFVVDATKINFTKEAIDLLKIVKKSDDDLGDIDSFRAGDKKIFSWLGGPKRFIEPETITGSNDYDVSFLIAHTEEIAVPNDFKDIVDEYLGEDPQ